MYFYYINHNYCDYLRNFDDKVAINSFAYHKEKRPFIGIILQSDRFTYFAPLASPKPKHFKMPVNMLDCIKIDNGRYGVINLNNMIPVNSEDIEKAEIIA